MLCAAGAAQAGNAAGVYLTQAKVLYQETRYEKALERLARAARRADATRPELVEIELYSGLCEYSLAHWDAGRRHLKIALELDPNVALPEGLSPRIVDEINSLRPAPPPAPSPVATESPPAPAAPTDVPVATASTVAPVAPPVPLPASEATPSSELTVAPESHSRKPTVVLLSAGILSGAAGAVLGVLAQNTARQANSPSTYYADSVSLGNTARHESVAANACFAAAGAFAVAGVVTFLTGH